MLGVFKKRKAQASKPQDRATMPTTALSALVNLISSNVQSLEAAYTSNGATFPSLDEPFIPGPLDFDPALAQTKSLIVAAAAQLIASVSPLEALQDHALALYMTTSLGFVVDNHIPDILNEGGPQGVHVKDIAAKTGVEASYIARILRYLATRHVFREVAPDVFANNRLSSIASKQKTMKEIKENPEASFEKAPMACLLSQFADESITSSTRISEFLKNPKQGSSPFNLAFKTDAKVWQWYEMPGNEWRGKRFALAMKGAAERWPGELFVDGIGVKNMKDNDVVVDVGGSVGSCTLYLYKANPKLKYIVQDLSSTMPAAQGFWQSNAPEAVSSGAVTLQAQDFFQPQGVKGAAIYFLRVVIHDWPDKEAKIILKNLRDAASKSSKLILLDFVGHHVCEAPSSAGVTKPPAPYPLLANLGVAGGGFDTAVDLQMLNVLDGKHRLEEEWQDLGAATGWKLERIVEGILPVLTFSAV